MNNIAIAILSVFSVVALAGRPDVPERADAQVEHSEALVITSVLDRASEAVSCQAADEFDDGVGVQTQSTVVAEDTFCEKFPCAPFCGKTFCECYPGAPWC